MSDNSKAVITLPTDFGEGLFLPLEDDGCLVGMFSESKADADAFMSILNGDKHEDVVVDNKVFGLMAMLNTFNTFGHSDNEDVIWVYVHEAQALNEYITGIEGDIKERGSECSVELDRMMYITSLFLDNISDDYELGVFDRNDEE